MVPTGSRRGARRDRLVDGGLATADLTAVVAVGLALEVRAAPAALGAGAFGAIVLEALLQRRHDAVREAWERSGVKAATVGAFLLAVAAAATLAPTVGLSLLAGGLVGYLALLAGTAVGRTLSG